MAEGISLPPIDKSHHYIDMIVRLVLIVVLMGILMVSFHYYADEYKPATLSTVQYATFANEQETSSNPVQTVNEFSYVSRLSSCPGGQCAINKITGIKRCPATDTAIVTYDTFTEACTNKNTCDYQPLSFSVYPDGSTSESGICQDNDICRCTNILKCAPDLMSTFEITYGSNYTPSNDNYTIQQRGGDVYRPGLNNLEIKNPGTQFCIINPGFTNKMTNGCDLTNGINDKLDCENITSIRLQNVTSSPEEQPEFFLQTSINSGSRVMIINRFLGQITTGGRAGYDSNLVTPLFTQDITSGIVRITPGTGSEVSTKWEIVYFNGVNKYYSTSDEDDQNYLSLENIVHLFSSDGGGVYGSPGFHLSFDKNSELPRGYLYGFEFFNCLNTVESANYKNMSLCLQPEKQPCKEGFLTYRFDKLHTQNETSSRYYTDERFSRNFCQQRTNFNLSTRQDYLEDPGYYTMGCTLGSGCADTDLVLSSGLKGVEAAKEKYFPDFDLNAVRGSWTLIVTNLPYLDFGEGGNVKNMTSASLLNQDTIQPGDLWVSKTYSGEIIASRDYNPSSQTLTFYNIGGLTDYLNYGQVSDNFTSVLEDENGAQYSVLEVVSRNEDSEPVIGIVLNPNPTTAVKGDVFRILPTTSSVSPNYGIVTKNAENFFLGSPMGGFGDLSGSDTKVLAIEIFKQYSFSGANYNTVIGYDQYKGQRLIAGSTGVSFTYLSGSVEEVVKPPNTLQTYFLSEGLSESVASGNTEIEATSVFQDPNAEIKKNISMYYPVWNPVLSQQECVRCKPLLLSYPQITTQSDISQVFIQYSSKDFQDYQYNFEGDNYVFTSLSKLDTSPNLKFPNTTSEFYIENPNLNVSIGDFVIDSRLQFDIQVETDSDNKLGSSTGKVFIRPEMIQGLYTTGLEESYNTRFSYNGTQLEENGVDIIASGNILTFSGSPVNYFFGKKYKDTSDQGYYMIPLTTVVDISPDRKRITTNTGSNKSLGREETYIQFCKIRTPLGVTIDPPGVDPGDYSSSKFLKGIVSGSRAAAEVNSLVDGRIVNLKMTNRGSAYSYDNPPTVNLQNYHYPL
jgi:hypothetical protein